MRRRMLVQRVLALGVALAPMATTQGAGPAESLFRLTPPDVVVTLALEDVRGHTREFLASPLADRLTHLPFVQSWLASDRYAALQAARRQIEAGLGATFEELRDDLFGDAVLLTLRVPPGGREDESRGMLLLRFRDRKLLDRLIEALNQAQKQKGELIRADERTRNGTKYWVREFEARTKRPAEYYTILADETFAWSNSEEMVFGVIERSQGGGQGLGDQPRFRRVRERLPERSLISLFADPRFVEAQLAAPSRSARPGEAEAAGVVAQYLKAIDYMGAALEWQSGTPDRGAGLILHTEEAIDPEKVASWFKHWATRPSSEPDLDHVPASAIALVSARVDFGAVEELVRALTPSVHHRAIDNTLICLSGLMLGHDLKSDIFPKLGPTILAHAELEPGSKRRSSLALVASITLKAEPDEDGVAKAIDNGLRTLLSFYALDPKHGGGQLHLETRDVQGARLTALAPSSPFAYAVRAGRLTIGRTTEAVERALRSEASTHRRFSQLRNEYFPKAESFVCIDLERLRAYVHDHRQAIAGRIAARSRDSVEVARRDLDQALSLLALFRDAFAASTLAADLSSAHRMIGLITATELPSQP